ncbi:MAG: mechanosensitive ion channel family protein, partial [Alphaproteobacteria bacterium]|nr:mechanosensitive ion channel family protein [Alphaproteobacteria bacterium]
RILAEIERPISFLPVILGVYASLEYLMPDMDLKYKVPLFMSLGSIFFFWVIYNLIHPIAYFFNTVAKLNTAILEWVVRLIRLTLVLVGLASVLEMWGIQIAPIIAGLGLFGMAVALGAQDMFKNILAGLAIVSEKRFKVGEIIRLSNDVEGVVEHIGFRSTLIRRFDKAPVYVPNADLADAAVVNFSERNNRRISWRIGLEYRTTADQLRYIRNEIEAFILKNNMYSQPPESPIQVRLDSFGESSVTLMIYCFTTTKVWEDYLRAKEQLVLRVKEVVEAAGAAFAFPSQSLYIEQLLEDRSMRGKVPRAHLAQSEQVAKKNKPKLKDVGRIGEDY